MATPADSSGSSRSRALRTAALYLMLVGLPGLGVAAALQVGRGLTAPPSVGGTWQIATGEGGCDRAGGTLGIAQSGRRLDALYTPGDRAPIPLRGHLRGDTLTLDGPATGCDRVRARVTGAERVTATVQAGACGCRPTEATLVRAAGPDAGAH